MSPFLRATFFEIAGVYSLFTIMRELRTGIINNNRSYETSVRENPGGFYLTIICNAGFVVFAGAVVLHAIGLIGDPFVWIKQTFPFLVRHTRI